MTVATQAKTMKLAAREAHTAKLFLRIVRLFKIKKQTGPLNHTFKPNNQSGASTDHKWCPGMRNSLNSCSFFSKTSIIFDETGGGNEKNSIFLK